LQSLLSTKSLTDEESFISTDKFYLIFLSRLDMRSITDGAIDSSVAMVLINTLLKIFLLYIKPLRVAPSE
jgi:hypothetical protein